MEIQKKLELAKTILENEINDLEISKEIYNNLDEKYIGKELEKQTAVWARDVKIGELKIEALEHLIWEFENFLKQDADISKEENKNMLDNKDFFCNKCEEQLSSDKFTMDENGEVCDSCMQDAGDKAYDAWKDREQDMTGASDKDEYPDR